MTSPTNQADSTYIASERGLMIAVLIMVLLGAASVILMMS
jgi:hypothetical protein